ncbi:uncharacterized protein LOC143289603 [Babylonia areolata]|uniref:uncharacterized protein LOC143289603 n=1 Tax=Babylonia areolata TaxID=304850 RepID=UPI003FD0BEE2
MAAHLARMAVPPFPLSPLLPLLACSALISSCHARVIHTTTPTPIPTCRLPNGSLTQATQKNPVRSLEKYSCSDCFCAGGDYDYDYDLDSGEESDDDVDDYLSAICLAIDCLIPRCWDPRRKPGRCCPSCPHGENCIVPTRVVWAAKKKNQKIKRRRRREIIPAGKDREYGRKVCRCDDRHHYRYRKTAICKRKRG